MSNCVLYITDGNEKNVTYLLYSLKSLFKTNIDRNFDVVILTKKDLNLRLKDINSDIIQLVDDFSNTNKIKIYSGPVSSTATFERLFIPLRKEFSQYEKVLYLDCDTEIFSNINDIFSIKMGTYEILGRNEGTSHPHLLRCISTCERSKLTIKYNTNKNGIYINAGVIVMNITNILKRQNYENDVRLYLNIYDNLKFGLVDQDIINLFFNIKEMDKKYNSFGNEFNDIDKKIVHYICNEGKKLLNERINL